MKKGTTLGFISIFIGVLLTTLGSAFANHTARGGGTYSPAPGLLSQFQFSPGFLQCKIAQNGHPTSLQMFMFSTNIDSFTISGNMVTITGEMVSTTVLGVGPDRQTFAEIVPFTASGVDNATPGGRC